MLDELDESSLDLLTDLCQWWRGDLPLPAKDYSRLTGVGNKLDVPRTIRLAIADRNAARLRAQKSLEWPFERIVLARDAVIGSDARSALENAFPRFS